MGWLNARKLCAAIIASILSLCMADIRFTGSSFSDESTYLSSYGAKALFLVNGLEYSLNAERNQSPVRINDRLWAGIDGDFNKQYSWFAFYSNDSGIWRQGVGVGYEISDNILTYPYKHKISVAAVNDSRRGVIPSIRYKFQGYYAGFGLASTTFILGYTYTEDYIISYKLNPFLSLIYKGNFDDASKVSQSAVGVEVKI